MQAPYKLVFVISQSERYQHLKITSTIIELQILLLCDQLTYCISQKAYVKFQLLRNYYNHRFHDHMFLGSPKGTRCLKLISYHGAYLQSKFLVQMWNW